MSAIRIKRVYEAVSKSDGKRYLVDRMWPRGIKKEALHMDGWLKDVAPSDSLRRWFNHDPAKWAEFQRRYKAELEKNPDACQVLRNAAKTGGVSLLFSARDIDHNNALVLKHFLEDN